MPDQSSAATEHAILAEITRPLEALPEDPLAFVDANFPASLRGYDRTAVDEYVRVTRQLVAELQASRSPEAAVRRALERVGEQISGILQRAHETAEQITAQSRSEAEDRLEQARLEAAQVANAAEEHVRDLDADTDRIWLERQRIVADAEDLAAQLLGLAKTAAERFPADADAGEIEDGAEIEDQAEVEDETGPADVADVDEEAGPRDDAGEDAATEVAEPEDAATEVAEPDDRSEVAEPDDRSEVERTLAFQPLEAEGDQAAAGQGATDDDDTAVIPPASQAANRRANK
jgi:cell division septum initiation protein DivIVA